MPDLDDHMIGDNLCHKHDVLKSSINSEKCISVCGLESPYSFELMVVEIQENQVSNCPCST